MVAGILAHRAIRDFRQPDVPMGSGITHEFNDPYDFNALTANQRPALSQAGENCALQAQ